MRDRWAVLKAILPYLVTAALFALGLYALQRLLAPVDLREVVDQIHQTPWSTVAVALAATLCGYLALAGYDWSALRYIGKPLPIPVVLTGGLMAYAFGNTIGLSAVSGGAVRWRVYSRLGLDGYDVAAVSTFAAVSFGVAATLVGLAALAAHPGALAAIIPFGAPMVRTVALAAIAAIVVPLVIASVSGRALRIGRFSLRAPSLPVLAGQVVFSAADIGFSALTLYILLPSSDLEFLTFLAVFAAATMAGIISHVPGGVGVFETVVIAAMPASMPVGQVAAALLLFRLTYYLLPFALALIVLAIFELWQTVGGAGGQTALGRLLGVMAPGLNAVSPLAPLVLAAMIFGSGLWMSLAALVPPTSDAAEAAQALLPLAFVEGSALLSSALGAGLIVLALGVVRRSLGAWLLAVATMAAGAVVAIVDGFDLQRAAALAAGVLVLLPFRHVFHRRAILTHAAMSPGWIILVLSTIAAFGFVLFFAHKSTPYAHELWWQFAMDERAPRAWRAGLVGGLLVGVTALALLLHGPRYRPQPPDVDLRARAVAIAAAAGDPAAARALGLAQHLMLSPKGGAFIGFRIAAGAWISDAGPQGTEPEIEELAGLFADAARRAGARPVFQNLPEDHAALAIDIGLAVNRAGAEAVLDLSQRPDQAAIAPDLQAALTRAFAAGMSFRVERGADPATPARAILQRNGAEVAQARLWWQPGLAASLVAAEGMAADLAEVLLAALVLRLRDDGCPAVSLARRAEGAGDGGAVWQVALRLGAVPRGLLTAEPSTARPVAHLR
ncbi:MAG: lysylphosphatidylglycerol synthetase family protein [Paracoccaceae bacterium]|nr:MAG: lysylphosphatidylglycerol synthetase family protein [Paracoccaceae bacterium]